MSDLLFSQLAGNLTAGKIGLDVCVVRYFQPTVCGKLLRVHEGQLLVIEGQGSFHVAEISSVELAANRED